MGNLTGWFFTYGPVTMLFLPSQVCDNFKVDEVHQTVVGDSSENTVAKNKHWQCDFCDFF